MELEARKVELLVPGGEKAPVIVCAGMYIESPALVRNRLSELLTVTRIDGWMETWLAQDKCGAIYLHKMKPRPRITTDEWVSNGPVITVQVPRKDEYRGVYAWLLWREAYTPHLAAVYMALEHYLSRANDSKALKNTFAIAMRRYSVKRYQRRPVT